MEYIKNRRAKSGLRGVSRFCALQALYRAEFSSSPVTEILQNFDKNKNIEAILTESLSLSAMDRDFFEELLKTAEEHLAEIDQMIIQNLAKTWSIERLDPVTKCILRLGIAELLYFKTIPANVIFNEYIEIAKSFFETSEVSFINGLLNKVGKFARAKDAEEKETAKVKESE